MTNSLRTQLIELGPEQLADALLELSDRYPAAAEVIEGLLATPDENIERYKAKLADLKHCDDFVSWHELDDFAFELQQLLNDLERGVKDPCAGVDLLAQFFEIDKVIVHRCDDSGGSATDLFLSSATDLFVSFASQCNNKQVIADRLIKLNEENDYDLRDNLFNRAGEYLPEATLRTLIDELWIRASKTDTAYKADRWLKAIQEIAKQLRDAPLFEKARLVHVRPTDVPWFDIARVYLAFGDPQTALIKLQLIPDDTGSFRSHERQLLLLAVYRELGDTEAQTKILWQLFNAHHSQSTLTQLLDCIGHDQREVVVNETVKKIVLDPQLSYSDAEFLLEEQRIDELERYLKQRFDKINGESYYWLLPIAEGLKAGGKLLMSSLIYRSLTDSILARAKSKYYHHGVNYLKKLDQLAPRVTDWQSWITHDDYRANLQKTHKRKTAFWFKY